MMTLYYEGSDGSIIDLMNDGIYIQDPENLTANEWDYTATSSVAGIGKVKRFYKKAQKATVTVGIMADNAEEFNAVMYRIHRILDRDIRRVRPGKLWWNGWYKEVFAIETGNEDFEELFEAVERQITFLSVYPYWVKKIIYQYKDTTVTTGGIDYPHDMDHDYGMDDVAEVVENTCIDAANFEIKFYGPAVNPSVTIGGHVYEVLVTLAAGDTAVINSLTKTVIKYDSYGNAENVFHLRGRDDYVFEKIPEGTTSIVRSKEYAMDIVILDERGEPEWI